MKRSINLYPKEMYPRRQWGSLPQMIALWSGLTVLLLGCWSLVIWKNAAQQRQNELVIQRLNLAQTTLRQQLEQIKLQRPAPRLQSRIETAQNELKGKLQLLDHMNLQKNQPQGQFAELMYALAKLDQPGIWLRHIYMQHQQVELEGMAKDGHRVTRWLQEFKQYPVLARQSFAQVFVGERQNQGELKFILLGKTQDNAGGKTP